eukprot:5361626-Alexandrium_andersonii.AAC.1
MVFKSQDSASSSDRDRAHPSSALTTDNVSKLGAVIGDSVFWSYSHVMLLLGNTIKEFEMFFYSCSRHPERTIWHEEDLVSGPVRVHRQSDNPCPMTGRLGPQMASGQ